MLEMLPDDRDASDRRRPRVLLITLGRLAENMAGPAIRVWELAHVLSAYATVTIASADVGGIRSDAVDLIEFEAHSPRTLRHHLWQANVIVAQPQFAVLSSWLSRVPARIVYDLYDPELFELFEMLSGRRRAVRRMWLDLALDRMSDALRSGHRFICASETQRDLWIGAMYGQRLIAPSSYTHDPSFRSIIDVVPFGLPSQAPPASDRAAIARRLPSIGPEHEVVLWNGGLWNWLDPACAVRGFARLHARRPRARLVFMGAAVSEPSRLGIARARAAVAQAGLEDVVVFNDGWVPYAERADWLRAAACAISTHTNHLETRYAFRTRLLDCFWAGLPVVCTEGDELSELVRREGLGVSVAAGDDAAVAGALEHVLDRGRGAYAEALQRTAERFTWPRVAEPLVRYVLDPRLTRPLAPPTRGAWRRDALHQARHLAYHASHHPIHRVNQARLRILARRPPR